jgi:hypothetical protein
MTTTTIWHSERSPRITQFFRDARRGSGRLWTSSWIMLVLCALCISFALVDDRMINGVNIWEKPAKFFLSLGTLGLTVAWTLSLVPVVMRGVHSATLLLLTASWFELVYIVVRAIRGEASHFNVGTPLDAALYGMMGVGALSISAATAFVGFRVWQNRKSGLWREAAGIGLLLGSVLATVTAGYMSSGTGHWVGGDLTDATGLPFFHWSTTGGDLRVAHFIGLHAMQFVPFAALSGKRSIVFATALVVSALTVATFIQAWMGVPLFKL